MTGLRLLRSRSIRCLAIGLIALLSGRAVSQIDEAPVFARIELGTVLPNLPFLAILQDAQGRDYALVVAKPSLLRSLGITYRLLEANARASDYVIALERRPGARQAAVRVVPVVEDDGRSIVARLPPGREEALAALGFDLQRLSDEPMVIRPPARVSAAWMTAPDPSIGAMIAQVLPATVSDYVGQSSGAKPASIGGSPYILTTRHTGSGTPIAKATQLVQERLAALGLNVSYHDWSESGYSGRNVIGELPGTVSPAEIVLITAHLDDLPSGSPAPGADDNASGSAGVWIAAEVLSRYRFQRTLRFVFFTGEEQGLYGSARYAAAVAGRGENIVAVFNLDMIAWDGAGGPTLRLHTRSQNNPGYAGDAAIANAFVSVVNAFGLSGSLSPIITADGENGSDHASFWGRGYPGVQAIEDDWNDFNPRYHRADDVASSLNPTYFTNYVKAAVGTAAHLALPAQAVGPAISLNRRNLYFGATSGAATPAQSVIVGNSGTGRLAWTATSDRGWLSVAPASGAGAGIVTIAVNPAGLAGGDYAGSVSFSDPQATNSPQTVQVRLTVYPAGATAPPFGSFDTPQNNAAVRSSIPVTGWALDDIGVESVKIYRNPQPGEPTRPNGLVFIGDAFFVEGARGDVERAFPAYPMNPKAGWGYMMLTNFLPSRGNGTFVIQAIAKDREGHEAGLGTKTIIVDNAGAVKPFGTIDTPIQGGVASGTFVNFGWVLTPLNKTVPKDGSTIDVYIDSVKVGNLAVAPHLYNQYRADVSTAFPGLNNTGGPGAGGPVGAYFLDTTKYPNGVHSIHWVATDDAGSVDGIGSRFFTIVNAGTAGPLTIASLSTARPSFESVMELPVSFDRMKVRTGFEAKTAAREIEPDRHGVYRIRIPEAGRIEFAVGKAGEPTAPKSSSGGYLIVGEELRPLPIGATLDPANGIFSWLPGPGFLGSYDFVFVVEDESGLARKIRVEIRIMPKP